MLTKYILHGGYANRANEDNNKFFKEILSLDKKELNISIVLFAKEENEYNLKAEVIKNQFNINKSDKILNFTIAEEKNFVEQIKEADIIYIHGDETLKLLDTLRQYKDFSEAIKDKVVAGESAGVYVLSSWFYSRSRDKCFPGLGIVPVKTICHYVEKNKGKLNGCPPDLEELILPDYKFKVFLV